MSWVTPASLSPESVVILDQPQQGWVPASPELFKTPFTTSGGQKVLCPSLWLVLAKSLVLSEEGKAKLDLIKKEKPMLWLSCGELLCLNLSHLRSVRRLPHEVEGVRYLLVDGVCDPLPGVHFTKKGGEWLQVYVLLFLCLSFISPFLCHPLRRVVGQAA